MEAGKITWHDLPTEIRLLILDVLLHDGCSLAEFATVSREWQTIIEQHNFARIKLTPRRAANCGPILHRNRALVRYIWFCLELEHYYCDLCAAQDPHPYTRVGGADDFMVLETSRDLFRHLSKWEPNGDLLLDISLYSESDSDHWFKYLTFEPDVPINKYDRNRCAEKAVLGRLDDPEHGWDAGRRTSAPHRAAIEKVFETILDPGPLAAEWDAYCWQPMPLVPAVTSVLIRQQSRRRWTPAALSKLFACFPRLNEIHYESWREWYTTKQWTVDESAVSLYESLASSRLRRLVLFENFNQDYPSSYINWSCHLIRYPSVNISRAVAALSLGLEHLSASFVVDARYFFQFGDPAWQWPNLTSLALTSQLLMPNKSPNETDNMLQAAAAAAMNMPNLQTIEIWNGLVGLAMVFRYQRAGGVQPATITCRGTWEFDLRPSVIQA